MILESTGSPPTSMLKYNSYFGPLRDDSVGPADTAAAQLLSLLETLLAEGLAGSVHFTIVANTGK